MSGSCLSLWAETMSVGFRSLKIYAAFAVLVELQFLLSYVNLNHGFSCFLCLFFRYSSANVPLLLRKNGERIRRFQ